MYVKTLEKASLPDKSNHFLLTKLEGNKDCFNDVIIMKCSQSNAKYNLIYFGGDIQNYEEDMKKSSTCQFYTEWNLINTGYLLEKKFSKNNETAANILIFRADYFHLKCFANYSNFVSSTDFGIPISSSNDFMYKIEQNDESSISSIPIVKNDEMNNKVRCIDHMKKLYCKSLEEYNSKIKEQIDLKLPIILFGFSKGCIVLNQFCTELISPSIESSIELEPVTEFLIKIKHIFWLDGGHSGTVNSWITNEEIVQNIKKFQWSCYVYITPYQLRSQKFVAIQEYNKFIELLEKFNVNFKDMYYFKDQENVDYDLNLHFELLKHFDSKLN